MPSENGWNPARANGATDCEWVRIPGAEHVSLQFLKGRPLAILRAFAADYHAYIEPLRDADSAAYTPTNSVATSNHLNGTAMDLNWNSHPFRVLNAGFDAAAIGRIRELLAFYTFDGLQLVFWGNDWNTPKDAMHWNMGYETYGDPRVQRFIDQRIRPDGFSTYKRGAATGPVTPPAQPQQPAVGGNQVDVLARATGLTTAKATQIVAAVRDGLNASQCNNVNRIAMWLAQVGHESVSFQYTEEIAKNGRYAPYIGRTWIQITWDYNYRAFSKWCFDKGLVPAADYFVTNYRELADLKWAGLGAAWYWTVARPQINALSDARNLTAVTQAINGGQNGAPDRKQRYDRALALGDQLLALTSSAPTTPGDDMAQVPQDQWDRVYREVTQQLPSRSPLRHLGEGLVDTMAGFTLNADGHGHVQLVKLLAELGHPESLALLKEVADADPTRYPDRQEDRKVAQAILSELSAKPVVAGDVAPAREPVVTTASTATPVVVDTTVLTRVYEETASLREEVARLAATLAAQPAPATTITWRDEQPPSTTGAVVGKVVDAQEDYNQHLLGMGAAEVAALTTSLRALTPPNGAQS